MSNIIFIPPITIKMPISLTILSIIMITILITQHIPVLNASLSYNWTNNHISYQSFEILNVDSNEEITHINMLLRENNVNKSILVNITNIDDNYIRQLIVVARERALNGIPVSIILAGHTERVVELLGSCNLQAPVAVPTSVIQVDYDSGASRVRNLETVYLGILFYKDIVKYYTYVAIDGDDNIQFNIDSIVSKIYRDLFYINYFSSNVSVMAQVDFKYEKYPYGKINIRDVVEDFNDYNSNYIWRNYKFISQIIPGIQAFQNSPWHNSGILSELDADYYLLYGFLSDYDPTTTTGTSTVSVNLEVSVSGDRDGVSPGVGLSVGWSYSLPDVVVQDMSDFSEELAKWIHHINPDSYAGTSTYTAKPGSIFRFPEGDLNKWRTATLGQWAKLDCFLIFCDWEYTDYYGLAVTWIVG